MYKKLSCIFILMLSLSGCSSTEPNVFTSLEVKRVLEGFAEAAEQGDVEAINQWVHNDVYHWGLDSGRIHAGREVLMQALKEDTVAGEDFAKEVDPQLVSFRKITDDVVIVDILMVYVGHKDKNGEFYKEFKEPTVVVFSHKNGVWKIASVYAAGNRAETYRSQH